MSLGTPLYPTHHERYQINNNSNKNNNGDAINVEFQRVDFQDRETHNPCWFLSSVCNPYVQGLYRLNRERLIGFPTGIQVIEEVCENLR